MYGQKVRRLSHKLQDDTPPMKTGLPSCMAAQFTYTHGAPLAFPAAKHMPVVPTALAPQQSGAAHPLKNAPPVTHMVQRRLVLTKIVAAMSVSTLSLLGQPHSSSALAIPGGAAATTLSREDLFIEYPYAHPPDILPFLNDTTTMGDSDSVLQGIETFSKAYPMYIVGSEKGRLLEGIVQAVQPRLVVEVGSFIGYSAVCIARNLPPGGHLVCVEGSPDALDTARAVVQRAGLSQRVSFELGLAADVLPGLAARYGGPAQLLFEDHCKECYAADLQRCESTGLVSQDTWIVADNVLYPGAPDFLRHVSNKSQYATALLPAAYEYNQAWNPDWEPKQDAMALGLAFGLGRIDASLLDGVADKAEYDAAAARVLAVCNKIGRGALL